MGLPPYQLLVRPVADGRRSVLLSFATLWLDQRPGTGRIASAALTYSRGPEGARAILSAVAGSMVTIASLTFSITIVTLQLASSQFGPRLLRGFVRDRGNQVVLGTFIATFTYCLLVLRAVNGTEEHEFVPHLSVIVALLLTLASLASSSTSSTTRPTPSRRRRSWPRSDGTCARPSTGSFPRGSGRTPRRRNGPRPRPPCPRASTRGSRPVPATESDYLQNVDGERLLELAAEKDLVLRVEHRPGEFRRGGPGPGPRLARLPAGRRARRSHPGGVLLRVAADPHAGHWVRGRPARGGRGPGPVAGHQRPLHRGRLPGPARCVPSLASRRRETPSAYRFDEAGQLRVVAEATTMAGLVDAAFHQIRQAARTNAAVTLRLLETIAVVLPFARDAAFRDSLLRHAALVHEGSQEGLPSASDRRDAAERYRAIFQAPLSRRLGAR